MLWTCDCQLLLFYVSDKTWVSLNEGMWANELADEGDEEISARTRPGLEGRADDHQRHGGFGKLAFLWSSSTNVSIRCFELTILLCQYCVQCKFNAHFWNTYIVSPF